MSTDTTRGKKRTGRMIDWNRVRATLAEERDAEIMDQLVKSGSGCPMCDVRRGIRPEKIFVSGLDTL
jgi:hypothetical protein